MHVLTYLQPDTALYAGHLINLMSSSILYSKTLFSCLFHDKISFPLSPCVFGYTCFVQTYLLAQASCLPIILNVCLWATHVLRKLQVLSSCVQKIFYFYIRHFSVIFLFDLTIIYIFQLPVSLPILFLVPNAGNNKVPQLQPLQVYSYRPKIPILFSISNYKLFPLSICLRS